MKPVDLIFILNDSNGSEFTVRAPDTKEATRTLWAPAKVVGIRFQARVPAETKDLPPVEPEA